ncbi:MAG: MAPEG family protein [Myxococcota bacterium]|nr:MAPEG family protein [Myxococcota bacterium]
MTAPVITAATAGAILVLQQILMFTVGFRRAVTNRGVGHGDDVTLEARVRRHGNLAENSAIFLVVLGLLEMLGASSALVMGLGIAFVAARLFHAIGFSFLAGSHGGEHTEGGKLAVACRAVGATTTGIAGIVAGAWLAVTAAGLIGA